MSCLAMERLKQLITRYSLQKSHLGRHSDSVKVTFVNLCGENISIHWVNYDGEEVEYFSVDEVRPDERKEVLTFRTHPWMFKNASNQHMFVKYSDRVVKYFEALRYLTDKYESGMIRLPQFQLQVQGRECIEVHIVPAPELTLTQACLSRLCEMLEVVRGRGDAAPQSVVENIVDKLEIPMHLHQEIAKEYLNYYLKYRI